MPRVANSCPIDHCSFRSPADESVWGDLRKVQFPHLFWVLAVDFGDAGRCGLVYPCKISAETVSVRNWMRLNMAKIYESDRIADVMIVEPQSFSDERGRFLESYRRSWFPLGREMVQSSRSDKAAGSLVGLHYHFYQADYWYVLSGRAQVVLHDLRLGSSTEGKTLEIEAGDNYGIGIFIPPGVAHGFAAITDMTLTYLVDSYYNPSDELGVAWNDPEIGANWIVESPVYSQRDADNPLRKDIAEYFLPRAVMRT